jgi:SAM-dependent methyltransferase
MTQGIFLKKIDLKSGIKKAIEKLILENLVSADSYPEKYDAYLYNQYKNKKIYPGSLSRIGEPNIRKHYIYKKILRSGTRSGARLLDYGCGLGDDIRALLEDSYPNDKIMGYDINNINLNLGMDLYRDKEKMERFFRFSEKFPKDIGKFDYVYSGSVLHALENRLNVSTYLINANTVLNQNGTFFGSTLGTNDPSGLEAITGLYLLNKNDLNGLLKKAGFSKINVIEKRLLHSEGPKYRLWFDAIK